MKLPILQGAIGILLVAMITSCGDNAPTCKYGDAAPIFSQELPGVVKHTFEKEKTGSLESVQFDKGMKLEVRQSGCTALKQEFRFIVPGNYAQYPDSSWIKESVKQLLFLSKLSFAQDGLKMWAGAIELQKSNIKLGQPTEIEQGIFVKIDKILSPEQSILLVEMGSD